MTSPACVSSKQSGPKLPCFDHEIQPGQIFWICAPKAPPARQDSAYIRCIPSVSKGSPGGSSLPPLGHMVLVQGSFLADRPPGIS